jgi:hypothetical protein
MTTGRVMPDRFTHGSRSVSVVQREWIPGTRARAVLQCPQRASRLQTSTLGSAPTRFKSHRDTETRRWQRAAGRPETGRPLAQGERRERKRL